MEHASGPVSLGPSPCPPSVPGAGGQGFCCRPQTTAVLTLTGRCLALSLGDVLRLQTFWWWADEQESHVTALQLSILGLNTVNQGSELVCSCMLSEKILPASCL